MSARLPIAVLLLIYLSALGAPWLIPYDPAAQDRESAYEAPSVRHLLGTDGLGRDQFSRLVAAGQVSLLAGVVGTGLALFVGAVVGVFAGWHDGWTSEAAMRATEVFQALPWLYLLLAVRAALPLSVPPGRTSIMMVAILGLAGWPRPARLVRGVVLSAKERAWVHAARSFGAGTPYLLGRHVLPAAWPVLLTQAALLVPRFIIAEFSLSFLGLGVSEPQPSWGNMMVALRDPYVSTTSPWMLAPGFVVVLVAVCHQQLADLLQSHQERIH